MIIAENPKPSIEEFRQLMLKIDKCLNEQASKNPDYFRNNPGVKLEPLVADAAKKCAIKTNFEGSINLISGASFPDIQAANLYGIEVKSTEKNQWTSIGSSILESTRIKDVERIYLTFGKLGDENVEFRSKPYEECLSGISVTHYPRYQINMDLKAGDTIFDKMNIPYDRLRTMDDPVQPVAAYYKKNLRPGESLWWAGSATEYVNTSVSPVIRLWNSLTSDEKWHYEAVLYSFFPETITGNKGQKYYKAVLWLAAQGIVFHNFRDSFSAGGRVDILTKSGNLYYVPRIFYNIQTHVKEMFDILTKTPAAELSDFWEVNVGGDRIEQWIALVLSYVNSEEDKKRIRVVLKDIFADYIQYDHNQQQGA